MEEGVCASEVGIVVVGWGEGVVGGGEEAVKKGASTGGMDVVVVPGPVFGNTVRLHISGDVSMSAGPVELGLGLGLAGMEGAPSVAGCGDVRCEGPAMQDVPDASH